MDNAKPNGKKEIRKRIADKIETALPELLQTLGEKKFHNRVKKAAKLLTDGLPKSEPVKVTKKATSVPVVKAVVKKKAKAAKTME